uniref:Uncharacterized protein n=1 Tax=Anguilla anguilla TaxID=7936 RepID=A0A0E9V9E3_ANGAN
MMSDSYLCADGGNRVQGRDSIRKRNHVPNATALNTQSLTLNFPQFCELP